MIDDKIIMAIVGIVGGLIAFLQKVLYGQGQRLEKIVVKLIDRMNKSDELGIEAIDGRCYAVDVVSNPAVSGVVLVAFVPQHQQCEWLVVER